MVDRNLCNGSSLAGIKIEKEKVCCLLGYFSLILQHVFRRCGLVSTDSLILSFRCASHVGLIEVAGYMDSTWFMGTMGRYDNPSDPCKNYVARIMYGMTYAIVHRLWYICSGLPRSAKPGS